MQTFVPYSDFDRCAEVLDDRRLHKQRVEALQLMRAPTWPTISLTSGRCASSAGRAGGPVGNGSSSRRA